MNLNMCEDLIEKCITDSVVKMIPVKDILNDVLAGLNEPEVRFEDADGNVANEEPPENKPRDTELDMDSLDIPIQNVDLDLDTDTNTNTNNIKPIDDTVRINDISPGKITEPICEPEPVLPPTPPSTPELGEAPMGDICQELNLGVPPQPGMQTAIDSTTTDNSSNSPTNHGSTANHDGTTNDTATATATATTTRSDGSIRFEYIARNSNG